MAISWELLLMVAGAIVLSAGLFYWIRKRPVAIDVSQLHRNRLVSAGTQWAGTDSKGNFGELLTGLYLASKGWRQVPTQPDGQHNIDGLFVRKKPGALFHEVLITETKTIVDGTSDKPHYKERQMSDDGLTKRLGDLKKVSYIDEKAANEVIRGVARNAFLTKKILIVHHLNHPGEEHARIHSISKTGHYSNKGHDRWEGEDYHLLLDAAAIGVSRLVLADRKKETPQMRVEKMAGEGS